MTFPSPVCTAVNKASECDGIPEELFKTLYGNAIKVLDSTCQQIWMIQQWTQDWKRSILIPIPKKVVLNNVLTNGQLHSSPMRVRSRLKSCMLGFSIVNQELPDVQAGFRKGRGTRNQISNIFWIIEKAR